MDTLYNTSWVTLDPKAIDPEHPEFDPGLTYSTLLHEIGHSLGENHPNQYMNDKAEHPHPLTMERDTTDATVMSYNNGTYSSDKGPNYHRTPGMYDMLLLGDYRYGYNMKTNAGNTRYDLSQEGVQTIWDAGGEHDVFDASAILPDPDKPVWESNGSINLQEGEASLDDPTRFGTNRVTFIPYHVVVEDAIGSPGNEDIIGNAANNILWGYKGYDEMTGLAGQDTFIMSPYNSHHYVLDYTPCEDGVQIGVKPEDFPAAEHLAGDGSADMILDPATVRVYQTSSSTHLYAHANDEGWSTLELPAGTDIRDVTIVDTEGNQYGLNNLDPPGSDSVRGGLCLHGVTLADADPELPSCASIGVAPPNCPDGKSR